MPSHSEKKIPCRSLQQYRLLQAIAGVSGAVTGCAVAGVANIMRESASGAVFAGITNVTGGVKFIL